MGDAVNIFIDNLNALLWRLYELPMYAIYIGCLILFLILWFLITLIRKKRTKKASQKITLPLTGVFFLLLVCAIVIDKKTIRLHDEIQLLHKKYNALLNVDASRVEKTTEGSQFELNISTLKDSLQNDLIANRQTVNEAVELVTLQIKQPLAVCYIAVVDLTNSKLKIVLTPEIGDKYLTSTFAKQNQCFLAINGEAGTTPGKHAPLGQWTGNFIVKGKPLLLKDSKLRPFMAFDKNNKAMYSPSEQIDTTNNLQKYNTIWGRWDILINGKVLENKSRLRSNNMPYPRTIMGINRDGTILYLMIVDGRQPKHSLGLGLQYAAKVLQLIGARHAMACDQGGSSCMYISNLGGIINRPADGKERFTYTHFGLKLRD